MPPDPIPGTAGVWLARAKGKLVLAQMPLPKDAFQEDLCFYAQQAAELAIKAVYQQHGWMFEFIHNIGMLLDGLEMKGLIVPPDVRKADQLTIYAAETRYPGNYEPILQSEYDEAIEIAKAVIAWADELIE